MTGWAPADLIGARPADFAHPRDLRRIRMGFQSVAAGAEGVRVRWRAKHKHADRWVWVESSPALLVDSEGLRPTQFLDVIRDVTAQVGQEEIVALARRAAEDASAAKAEFLANMSHEIRTPLTAVLGFSGLLAARDDLTDGCRHFVDRIASASRGLLAIVNDVLDFSKLEAGQFELKPRAVPAVETVRDAVAMFMSQADEKGLELSLSTQVDMECRVFMDPERLRQILVNLVGNAIKFTDRGCVDVVVSHFGERLRVEVHDTGPGLTDSEQAKLFQRFSQVDASSTRRHRGTGLGLAICKGLAEAMGGEIGVRSTIGQGSCFYFDVMAPIVTELVSDAPEQAILSVEGVRVLVADDNPVNRELVRTVLERLGVEVSEARDGVEAVEAALARPFDVILMDILMPRLDGPGALRHLRETEGPNRAVPVIAFSAGSSFVAGAGVAFDGFIPKPIETAHLLRVISDAAHGVVCPDAQESICA